MDFKGPQTTRSIKLYEINYKNIWKCEYHSKGVTIEFEEVILHIEV